MKIRIALLTSVLILPPISVGAQVQDDGSFLLGTIHIQARKRDELAFEIPVAATIREGADLEFGSLDPGVDLARTTPNFNYVDFAVPGNSFGSVRGIGPLGSPLNSLDNTIGFSTNGVPTTSFGFSPTLFDVEQAEVLRGPQGTLFGRNALGGAVNIVTRRADGVPEFIVGTEVGEAGLRTLDLAAGGWVVPDLVAGRVALRFQEFDGDIPNGVARGKDGDASIAAGRISLAFDPDGPLSADLVLGRDRDRRNNPIYLWAEHPDFPVSGSDMVQVGERVIDHISLSVQREFEGFTFHSVTGFQDIAVTTITDDTDSFLYSTYLSDYGMPMSPGAFSDPDEDWGIVYEGERVFSQEFRLNSPEGAPVEWVAGLSYFRSRYDMDRTQQSNYSPSLNGHYDTTITSQTLAVFGDISAPVSDRLTFSAGLRAARDRQTFDTTYVSNGAPGTVPGHRQSGSFEDDYVTGRVAVDWRWNDEWMSYASISRGYASGGFERYSLNAYMGLDTPPFRPSTSWAYELGTKAELLDGRLSLSGALFYNDVADGQLTAFDAATMSFAFDNQDYRSYGAELEFRAELTHHVALRGGVGWTRTRLVDVPNGVTTGAMNGNRVPNMPEITASLGLDLRYPLGRGEAIASLDVSHVGGRMADIGNSWEIPSYTVADLRVGWERDGMELYAFARNLTDERPIYFSSTFSPNAHSAIVGRGRVLGLGATWRW